MASKRRSKEDLIEELSALLVESEPDGQSTTDEKYAEGLLKAHDQVVKRNILLTNLLENYIKSHSEKIAENRRYKRIMFFTFVGAFVLFTGATLWVFLRTDFSSADIPQVVSLLSVGATYIGSVFVAYEIMFKYLFPSDEEKDMISMIKTVIENDLKVEEFSSIRLAGRTTKVQDSHKQDSDGEQGSDGDSATDDSQDPDSN